MAEGVPAGLSPAAGRRFGLTVGAAFAGLTAIAWWRGHLAVAGGLGGLASALALAGLAVPGRLDPVYRAWMGLARGISRFTTPVFLGIVYFLVITPVGLGMRLLGRNPLRRGTRGSHWVSRDRSRQGTMANQF